MSPTDRQAIDSPKPHRPHPIRLDAPHVHLCGLPAEMDAIDAIVQVRGLVIIADASRAHDARRGRQRAGRLGDAIVRAA